MYRTFVLACGVLAYAGFLVAFAWLAAFMAGIGVASSSDAVELRSLAAALLINTGLVSLFALQHAVMARDAFKSRWTRIVPKSLERSLFVVAASLCVVLMCWQWRPIPLQVWNLTDAWLRGLVWFLFAAGVGTVLYTSFLIDHFDLFGLRQVWLHFRGRPYTPVPFTVRSLYKHVRHPMMLGFLLSLWFVPSMTLGHLQFSGLMTVYLLVGIHMEERSLLRKLGEDYHAYHQSTPMLIPRPFGRRYGQAKVAGPLASESDPA